MKSKSLILLTLGGILSLAGFFVFPETLPAAHCPNINFQASGYFFDDYQQIEYVNDFLVIHLQFKTPFNDGRPWSMGVSSFDEQCSNGSLRSFDISGVSVAPEAKNFSIRFASQTHFQIWNDETNIPETCASCSGDIFPTPSYYEVILFGAVGGGASHFSTTANKINQTGVAPQARNESLPTPPNCSPISAHGYFFDSYESAEYANGFLRYHFRVRTPYNDGRGWNSALQIYNDNCQYFQSVQSAIPVATRLPALVRYYSIRFSDSHHYDIWDDESNVRLSCAACSVEMPPGLNYRYASFSGSIDGGASAFTSTPFAVTAPAQTRNPVIIVPGILGSELWEREEQIWPALTKIAFPSNGLDALKMDDQGNSVNIIGEGDILRNPSRIFNYSQALIEELENNGYTENIDLFVFPYDWRKDLDNTVSRFKDFVNTKIDSGSKADIIAHSTGGLVVKKYLLDYGKERVDKLIFTGVPHLGAPKAGKVLIFGDQLGIAILNHLKIKEIGKNMTALNQLLPNSKYFNNIGGYIKTKSDILNYEDTKSILSEVGLNDLLIDRAEDFYSSGINDLDLSGIDAFNINGCNTATIGSFKVDTSSLRIPIMIDMVAGDETVPLGSSSFVNTPSDNTYFVKRVKHSTMMSNVSIRQLISGILTETPYSDSNIIQDKIQCKLKGKILGIFSPVDVKITDQDGNYSGPNENGGIDENIPGAAYEILGEEKFVFLPTDENQFYNITLDATANGSFDMKITDVDGNDQDTIYYNNVEINENSIGNVEISNSSDNTGFQFDFEGDGTFEILNNSSILNETESGDETSPTTTLLIASSPVINTCYKEAQISFNATDDNSGVLKTEYSLDEGESWLEFTEPFSLSNEGNREIWFSSTDRAGNREEIRKQTLIIDQTAPEASISWDQGIRDLKITGIDDCLPVIVQDMKNKVILTDQAGNITEIWLKRKNKKNHIEAEIEKIKYNGIVGKPNPNKALFVWAFNRFGNLNHLNQILNLDKRDHIFMLYQGSFDQTVIREKTAGVKTKITKPGIIFLNIKTNEGEIGYEY